MHSMDRRCDLGGSFGPTLPGSVLAIARARRTLEMATTAVNTPQRDVEHLINSLKSAWRRFGTPVLILLMAFAIVLTLTRNWNAWEGGRADQITDDAFVRRDVTPLGTK